MTRNLLISLVLISFASCGSDVDWDTGDCMTDVPPRRDAVVEVLAEDTYSYEIGFWLDGKWAGEAVTVPGLVLDNGTKTKCPYEEQQQ
jgi:hypothetical protein